MSGKLKGWIGSFGVVLIVGLAAYLIFQFGLIQKLSNIGIGASNSYMVIHEWGVRFKIGDDLAALLYGYDPTADKVYFTTSLLKAKGGNCVDTTLGSLEKHTTTVPNAKKIGNYYYLFVPMTGNACSDVEETRKFQEAQSAAVTEAVKSLEKAP